MQIINLSRNAVLRLTAEFAKERGDYLIEEPSTLRIFANFAVSFIGNETFPTNRTNSMAGSRLPKTNAKLCFKSFGRSDWC